jgi:hypothetical protein
MMLHVCCVLQVSETEGALTRTYFSDAHKKAAQKVWVELEGRAAAESWGWGVVG